MSSIPSTSLHPKASFPPAGPADDARQPWTEQGWTHHRLFYALFKPGVSPERIESSIPRLRAFIERRTKILSPGSLRDISELSMKKFFHDDWAQGREDAIGSLFVAYLKAGYLSVDSTCPLKSIGDPKANQAGDRPLLQQVLDMSSAVSDNGFSRAHQIQRLAQSLVEAGADLSSVPACDLRIDNMSFNGVIKRGDIRAYAAAKHGPGSKTTLFVHAVVMNAEISAAQLPASTHISPEVKARRLGL